MRFQVGDREDDLDAPKMTVGQHLELLRVGIEVPLIEFVLLRASKNSQPG